MKLAVCLKQVPSTESRITVSTATNRIDLAGVDWVISPYDEYALEEALRLREKFGGAVTAFTLGPDRARNALKTALATGADNAQHILAEETSDPLITAQSLAAALKDGGFDIVFCGYKAVDDDLGAVGIALAEYLGLPHVSSIVKLSVNPEGTTAQVHREIEGAIEVIAVPLPAVFTAQKGLNEPRYPSLRGMMLANKKEIPVTVGKELLNQSEILPRISELYATLPPERKSGRVLEGTAQECVTELVRALREEARVI